MTMAPPRTRAPRRAAPGWLVCLETVRDVRDGCVSCPELADLVDVGRCRTCHLLVAIANERDPEADCLLPVVPLAVRDLS